MEEGTSWSDWLQGVAGGVIQKASEAKWVQPYQTEQMRLQALGPNGAGYYAEGQRQPAAPAQTVAGIPKSTLLLVGGAAVVLLLVMNR
jgi:hypothetical protein